MYKNVNIDDRKSWTFYLLNDKISEESPGHFFELMVLFLHKCSDIFDEYMCIGRYELWRMP